MKALFFAKPIEFRLETAAETLAQGDVLEGTFVAVNRGAEPLRELNLSVELAYGEFRKVKDNPAKAFDLLEQMTLAEAATLEPNREFQAPWRFVLAPDCAVTSSTGSLFLLYGHRIDGPGGFGMLDLRVSLSPVLEAFISTVENHFSFTAGSRKAAGEFTEVGLKPPPSYPTLEKMQVLMRLRDEGMELVYQCKLKAFERGAAKGVQSKSVRIERAYPRDQVLIGAKHPNRALFRAEFEAVLAELVPALFKA